VLFALEAMHDAGLFHRDIRPDNLLVDDTGRVVLIDFAFGCDAYGEVSDASRYSRPLMSACPVVAL
jgi:serine/threonine protein kinase